MIINYRNVELEIYVNDIKYDYNINDNVDVIRDKFNDSISKLSQQNTSLDYWLMRISERNTLVNNLFLDICRIELIETLLKGEHKIHIGTNNLAIYAHFKKRRGVEVKAETSFIFWSIFHKYKPYLVIIKFLMSKFILFMNLASLKKRAAKITNTVIIQTRVSDSNIKNGIFRDSYYSNLADKLRDSGRNVLTWPIIYNSKNKKALSNFFRKKENYYILMDDYLTSRDYISGVSHFLRKRKMKLGHFQVNESDYSSVLKYYQNREALEMSYFIYCFSRQLALIGSKAITFIVSHENMIHEKALILGVEKYMPESKVVGYFHTVMPKNILCLDYANQDEYRIAPKPKVILFNSSIYKELFEIKYPSLPVENAIALKQLHLNNEALSKEVSLGHLTKTLIIFSGTLEEVKLMFKLLNEAKNNCQYLFRMHPMNPFKVNDFYKNDNYELVNDEPLDLLLLKTQKIISTYSALAVECALKGYKIGLVYDNTKLLLNPFEHTSLTNYQMLSNVEEVNSFLSSSFERYKGEQIFNLGSDHYCSFKKHTAVEN